MPRDPASDRTWEQEAADAALSGYPHRLEVTGAPRSLQWPRVCAHCTSPASGRIRVRRAFYWQGRRRAHGVLGYRVVSADVPYCAVCIARHRDTVPRVSWLRRYGWWVFNPAHIATVGFSVMLFITLRDALDGPLLAPEGRFTLMLLLVFGFGIAWTIAITWWMTRPDRFEPLSEITASCLVSQDVSQWHEQRRHIYGFRNGAFADAFQRANQSRVWTTRDQRRMWRTSHLVTILMVAGLLIARLAIWYVEGE